MVKRRQFLMALDFGTGAGRCYLISVDGQQSFEQYSEWEYSYPPEAQPGGSEFNAEEFWDILSNLIRRTIKKAGIDPAQIIAVSSTSQREGVVFLDKNGKELYAGPNLDMRAPRNSSEFEAQFAESIHASSGHWPMPMFLPYRLLWFKENKPEIYEKIDSIVLLNNWILFRLSGERITDPSNGVETLLVDLKKRDWNSPLIKELGFPERYFPPVYESGTFIGKVTTKAAAETGLSAGTAVVSGGADSQCGLLGNGAVAEGEIGVTLGTYGPLQMVLNNPVIAKPELTWSGCHVVPNTWVIESTSMEAGQTFRWIRDIFYANEIGDVYTLMEKEASTAPPGSNGLKAYIGPRLPNYRNLDFNCSGGFVTQLPATPGRVARKDFSRAALEAVAYGVKLNVDRLQRVAGLALLDLRACGGLTKSRTLLQIMANLLQVPVFVPKQKEGSALGAAICAGVGANIFKSMIEGAQVCVKEDLLLQPEYESGSVYQELFADWKQHYKIMYGERILEA